MARFFHRSVAIVMALAMVVGTLAFGSQTASAQCDGGTCAPGSSVVWGSAINIQNRSATAATISIDFYRGDGTLATTYTPSQLGGNASVSIYVPRVITALPSGQYSAVVNSTEPVNVSVNTGSINNETAPWTEFAYEGTGTESASTTLYFPLLQNKYYNFDSEMVLQNTASADATVTATFYNAAGQQIATANLGTIKSNAAGTFTVGKFATTPALPSGNSAGNFGAVVTSTQPLSGIVNTWRSTPRTGTASYTAFASGASTLYAPAISVDYYDFISATNIQNISNTSVDVRADYTLPDGSVVTRNYTLGPKAARQILEFTDDAFPVGNKLISAKFSTSSPSLVGLISQSIPDNVRGSVPASPGGDFAAYALPSTPAASVSIPSVTSDYYGLFVAVNVQNTGTESTNVTITYAPSTTCPNLGATRSRTFTIAGGKSQNILHLNNTGDILPDRCSTSAVVTSSNANSPIVATIQQNTANNVLGYNAAKRSGDFLSAITGISQ